MNILSDIVDTNNVHANTKGYLWFRVDGKTHVRKIKSKPFSNWLVVTVRFKNKEYLVDSKLDNLSSDDYFNRIW